MSLHETDRCTRQTDGESGGEKEQISALLHLRCSMPVLLLALTTDEVEKTFGTD
jgi:hypothetical protein